MLSIWLTKIVYTCRHKETFFKMSNIWLFLKVFSCSIDCDLQQQRKWCKSESLGHWLSWCRCCSFEKRRCQQPTGHRKHNRNFSGGIYEIIVQQMILVQCLSVCVTCLTSFSLSVDQSLSSNFLVYSKSIYLLIKH